MSYYTYRGLLSKIGRQLSQHDHQQLLETCGLDDEADNIPDARSLLKRLEGKSHLGIDRLGVLKEVLKNFAEFTLLEKLMEFEKERKGCKNLLAKISDALDSDERNHLEQLKDICRRRQTSLELDESISNIRTLFEELEKHESLDFCALDFLKEILTEIEKEDLVKEIEEYEQRRNKNDRAEIRKAKFYSLGKVVTDKVAQEVMGETKGKKIGTLRCRGLKPPVIRGYAAAFNYWFCAFGHTEQYSEAIVTAEDGSQRVVPKGNPMSSPDVTQMIKQLVKRATRPTAKDTRHGRVPYEPKKAPPFTLQQLLRMRAQE